MVDRMRRTGRLAAELLNRLIESVRPGITTVDLDDLCFELAIENGAYPSPLGYGPAENPFPASICTSPNEIVCHGIPDGQPLAAGDIVSIDVTVYREGVHGDTCATVAVGDVSAEAESLIERTRAALDAGIAAVAPGMPLSVIGSAIERVAEASGLGVIRDFVGHGIGATFHSAPQVPHYRHRSRTLLQPGMTFTIEPMICLGSGEVDVLEDGWTALTADRSLCAQFEHTIYLGDSGPEVLTTA